MLKNKNRSVKTLLLEIKTPLIVSNLLFGNFAYKKDKISDFNRKKSFFCK